MSILTDYVCLFRKATEKISLWIGYIFGMAADL
jgi:hypothetical protein